jgi:alkanesulfonate monooxygenase SsuD/methylene tetrahydromethanopterin reductase-like flavin-dependent oxidoreductase (luciferase family)
LQSRCLTQVAAVAHHTSTIRIGIAVTPVYTRTPAVIAASMNVIGQLLPGRFVMGIGSSSQTIMGQWNGIPLDKPLTRVKETAIMVRSMLAGEKSDFQGETLSSRGYRQAPLDNPPPVYIGALRPKMIEMAAEFGQGVIFNLWPKSVLPKMMEHVKIGAERAGLARITRPRSTISFWPGLVTPMLPVRSPKAGRPKTAPRPRRQ